MGPLLRRLAESGRYAAKCCVALIGYELKLTKNADARHMETRQRIPDHRADNPRRVRRDPRAEFCYGCLTIEQVGGLDTKRERYLNYTRAQ